MRTNAIRINCGDFFFLAGGYIKTKFDKSNSRV